MDRNSNNIICRIKAVLVRLRHDEKGAALITALMFMLILTLLGLATVMTSSTELMISRNYRLNTVALDYANAGVQDALARLDQPTGEAMALGNYTTMARTADPAWSQNFTSTDGGITLPASFSGTIKYKTEDGLHHFTGYTSTSPRVVGYSKDCNYVNSPIELRDTAFPVYVITSTGNITSGGQEMGSATVIVEVSRNTLNLNAPGGLYSSACVSVTGSANVDGGGAKPSIVTPCTNPIDPGDYSGGDPVTGAPFENLSSTTGPTFIGVSYDELKKMAQQQGYYFNIAAGDTPIPPWGSEQNPAIVFIDGDYTIQGNSNNYGILVITGDFVKGNGTAIWNGLVYVKGNLTMSNGTFQVNGAVMAGGAVQTALGGTADINYNYGILENIMRRAFRTKLINWRRKYSS